jgi:hypothetical protein
MTRRRIRLPDLSAIQDDTPLRLHVAAALFFRDGSMTAQGFRREADKGRLTVWQIAGKDYTSRAAVEAMKVLCVRPAKPPPTATKVPPAPSQNGSARAALMESLERLLPRKRPRPT